MMKYKKWTESEDSILTKYHVDKTARDIAVILGRSLTSVQSRISRLGLTSKWSEEEIRILIQFYPTEGVIIASRLPGRTHHAIRSKAHKMGIRNINKEALRKPIMRSCGTNRVVAECKKHGVTTYYRYGHRLKCIKCSREWLREYRKSSLGNYKTRIQSSLQAYARHKISFSRHLPYNADQLHKHLEHIRRLQKNRCPMCGTSYDINRFDIDHVIPLSSATTIDKLRRLYYLDNLTLLCFRCNRFVKRDRMPEIVDGVV